MRKNNVIIIKAIILLVLLVVYNSFLNAYEPIFTNELAMQQMQNMDTSSSGIAVYSYLKNYTWVIFLITGLLLFRTEIAKVIKLAVNKIKNMEEKTNEEESK